MCRKMIYLDDAINAVKAGAFGAATLFGRTNEGMTALAETVRLIKDLPAAQPEIIRCNDCKYYINNRCYKIKALDDLRGSNDFCSYAERRQDDR